MYKFLAGVFFVLCCVVESANAGPCGVNSVKLSGTQKPEHDEFLYENKTVYDAVPSKNGVWNDLPGNVWECDNEYCGHGEDYQMEPGHVFGGVEIPERRVYKCVTNGLNQSHWEYEVKTKVCGETHISYDGTQKPDHDEFLYSTKAAYDSVRNRPDGGTVAGGLVFECDNDHCTKGTKQPMDPNHYFEGKLVEEAAEYVCRGNRWERIYEACPYRDKRINVGDWYVDNAGNRIVLNYGECSQFQDKNPANENKLFNARCERVGSEEIRMVCHAIGADVPDKPDDPVPDKPDEPEKPTPQPRKTCRQLRTTLNGKACCDTLAMGDYNAATDSCVCKGGLKFVIENGTGYCRAVAEVPVKPGQEYTCQPGLMTSVAQWKVSCVDNADIIALIAQIEAYCANENRTEAGFMAFYNTLLLHNPQQCGKEVDDGNDDGLGVGVLIITSRRQIDSAISELDGIRSGFKVSVWKDEEGKFNTSRLVSDSVAGVVLGTAGGLIISNVVKKNQVENGFEDIQCTVGGQKVADWGDEFRVGIQ